LDKSENKISNILELSYSNKISEDSQEYNNSPENSDRDATKVRTKKKRHTVKDGYYTKLVKKTINKDDPLEQWRNIPIEKIVSKTKLKSKDLGNI